jgi:hypothetical protein
MADFTASNVVLKSLLPGIHGPRMINIPKRYSHFLFGLIQSGFTCAIAAGIASAPLIDDGMFLSHWLRSWIFAWAIMIPFVLLATPVIRKTVETLTREPG